MLQLILPHCRRGTAILAKSPLPLRALPEISNTKLEISGESTMLTIMTAMALAAAAPAAPATPAQSMPMGQMPIGQMQGMDMSQMDHGKMGQMNMATNGAGCCKQTADGKMECAMPAKTGPASAPPAH